MNADTLVQYLDARDRLRRLAETPGLAPEHFLVLEAKAETARLEAELRSPDRTPLSSVTFTPSGDESVECSYLMPEAGEHTLVGHLRRVYGYWWFVPSSLQPLPCRCLQQIARKLSEKNA